MTRRSRALLTRARVTCLTAAVALPAACGSSLPTRVGADVRLVPTTTAVSDAWPLGDHVVTPAAFPGFLRLAPPTMTSSSSGWAAVEPSAPSHREAGRLRALGFVRAIDEHLYARFPVGAEAVSIAEQYRSQLGARAELAHQYEQLEHSRGAKVSRFPVGIPGAYGVRTVSGGLAARNVMFSAGPYYYVLTEHYPSNARNAPTATRIVAAARILYLTVTGCSAPGPAART
jgi:hypothetical protein